MKKKTLDFLKANQSKQPSTFFEDSKKRKENEAWRKCSLGIALSIVDYVQANDLSRTDAAERLGVSQQCLSHILKS